MMLAAGSLLDPGEPLGPLELPLQAPNATAAASPLVAADSPTRDTFKICLSELCESHPCTPPACCRSYARMACSVPEGKRGGGVTSADWTRATVALDLLLTSDTIS